MIVSAVAVASTKDLLTDLSPLIQVYLSPRPTSLRLRKIPPPLSPPKTSSNIPKLSAAPQKLPILLYHHGGGFCLESALSLLHHRYANLLSAASPALILSPEHPLPAAYHDSASALRWLCSHALDDPAFEKDPWIADLGRIFIAGDGSGANIAHSVAMRVGAGSDPLPGNVKVNGAILCHRFSAARMISSRAWVTGFGRLSILVLAVGSMIRRSTLSGLGCSRMIVCLAERVGGEVETAEYEGAEHCFQNSDTHSQNAKKFVNRLVSFISRCS